MVWILFHGISTVVGYLIRKRFLIRNSSGTIWYLADGDKSVYAFPKGIRTKVNIIAQLEFELTCQDDEVQHVRYYATETPPYLYGLVSLKEIRSDVLVDEGKMYSRLSTNTRVAVSFKPSIIYKAKS